MSTPVLNYITEQDYLKAGTKAFEKHGYYKSETFALNRASLAHNDFFSNLPGELGFRLKDKNVKEYILVDSTIISVENLSGIPVAAGSAKNINC